MNSGDNPRPELVAYVDGGSRGNPGEAGAGVYLEVDEEPYRGLFRYLGRHTNNYAEYTALLEALDFALENGFGRVRLYSDSELLVRQIHGDYRVKNPDLQVLHREAMERIRRLSRFTIAHVPREQNKKADRLANMAQDLRCDGEEDYRS